MTSGTPKPGFAIRTAGGQLYLSTRFAQEEDDSIGIVRLHHDGAIDSSFGEDGFVSTTLPAAWELGVHVTAAALQANGRVVLGMSNPDMVICRLTASGPLDATFGAPKTPGCIDAGDGVVGAVLVQPDGKIVLAGAYNNADFRGTLVRLHSNGSDVPPILSSTKLWSPIPHRTEVGHEEAVFGRTDHRFPA